MTAAELHGLRGEVIDADVYRMRELNFVPAVVFDFGANVGCFTELARSLWPDAMIIGVEPDDENFCEYEIKFGDDHRVVPIHAAIGIGQVYRIGGALNGAHECYRCLQPGFTANGISTDVRFQRSAVDAVMPDTLIARFAPPEAVLKFVVKIDIEGAENIVFAHQPSVAALKRADYLAVELHHHAMHGGLIDEVRNLTRQFCDGFAGTHATMQEHVVWRAVRKVTDASIQV